MKKLQSQMLAARWIVPVTSEPIHGGWVEIDDGQVVAFGSGKAPRPAKDLGDIAILPGLVNAHTHLEFSDCSDMIGFPGISLPEWIGQVVSTRRATDEISRSEAIARGMRECARTGTCLVGEITTPPCNYPSQLNDVDLISFAEVLGLSSERGRERFDVAKAHLGLDACSGVSPHAPYSTSRETLEACLQVANAKHRSLAMHVAESPYERELLESGAGPFAEALKSMGVWRDKLFPWPKNPFLWLIEQLARAPRSLLIHANDFSEAEIVKLAEYPHLTVVYCPRTHHFFNMNRTQWRPCCRTGCEWPWVQTQEPVIQISICGAKHSFCGSTALISPQNLSCGWLRGLAVKLWDAMTWVVYAQGASRNWDSSEALRPRRKTCSVTSRTMNTLPWKTKPVSHY